MGKKLRVMVLFGGRSTEHEVSIRSAKLVIKALDPARYEVIPVAISRSGKWLSPVESAGLLPEIDRSMKLIEADVIGSGGTRSLIRVAGTEPSDHPPMVDVVFPVLHGTFGEDGTVQGILELADVPYVGSGVLSSAVVMDKDVTKRLLLAAGLPTVEFVALRRADWQRRPDELISEVRERFDFPVFTKPANSGSSVGIRKVHDASELSECLSEAFSYDRKVLVEEALSGHELECSVLGYDEPRSSVVGEIIPGGEFYDYAEKYLKDTTELVIPAEMPAELVRSVQELAVGAFKTCGCEGLARVDLFLETGTGRLLISELNTMPGFTSISMYPKLWEASGLSHPELVDELIKFALVRHRDRSQNRLSYES